MRPTPRSSGRQGRTAKVAASGMAIMSDSSIALKPVIEEPSKPIPPSKASSSSSALMEKLFSWPRMSVNQRRMKRMSRSLTRALTSSAVFGWSAIGLLRRIGSEAKRGRLVAEPGSGPGLQGANGGLEGAALVGHRVLDANRRAAEHAALDDALGLELLEAFRQEAVGDVRHEVADLGEVGGAVEE